MSSQAFNFKLNCKIRQRTVTIGKYDGVNPCLTAATSGGKIFIHNPHHKVAEGGRITVADGGISLLNINQTITSTKSGKIRANQDRDVLIVGTPTNLLVYDVFENKDVFYKEVPDGVNTLQLGYIGNIDDPLIIVGGNCTLQGFDADGEDRYWTVTGDNVCCLTLADFNNDGKNELIVGSEDFDIRIFQEDEIISEISESEAVTNVVSINGSSFGYSLANGTIGVYDRNALYWRIKSKNQAVSLAAFDINGDGKKEIVTGWSNGLIDARNTKTGEIVFKDSLKSAIADVLVADYVNDGTTQLIVCSVDGEVRGYRSAGQDVEVKAVMQNNAMQDKIRELYQIKQGLLHALQNLQSEGGMVKSTTISSTEKTQSAFIPLNTEVQTSFAVRGGVGGNPPIVELVVQTNNNQTIMKMVVIFAEGIFEDESQVVHPQPNAVCNKITVPISPMKNIGVELHVKAYVGTKNSTLFHVFEVKISLPMFSMYCYMPTPLPKPQGWVKFMVTERLSRLILWVQQNFLLLDMDGSRIDLITPETNQQFSVNFLSLRGGGPLVISCDNEVSDRRQVAIETDDFELAGEIIQSLATYFALDSLQVTADFPHTLSELSEMVSKVGEMHITQQKLSAEMSDHSNLIRNLVVRAEDSRLMEDYIGMKKGYSELYDLNRDLMNGYHIRCNNHNELISCLKAINQIIQRAGNLRYGKHKTAVIKACRDALKKNDPVTMVKVIQSGS